MEDNVICQKSTAAERHNFVICFVELLMFLSNIRSAVNTKLNAVYFPFPISLGNLKMDNVQLKCALSGRFCNITNDGGDSKEKELR